MNTNKTSKTAGAINKIMEEHWKKHGVESSAFELSGLIHRRFPNKKGDYIEESFAFIRMKQKQLRESRRPYTPDKSHIARFQTREQRGFVFEIESFRKVFQENIEGLQWTFPSAA